MSPPQIWPLAVTVLWFQSLWQAAHAPKTPVTSLPTQRRLPIMSSASLRQKLTVKQALCWVQLVLTSLSEGLLTQGSPPYQTTTGPDRTVTSQHSLELSRGFCFKKTQWPMNASLLLNSLHRGRPLCPDVTSISVVR